MESKKVREQFLRFFQSKGHMIVPSAPIVIKDDPSLMFTNAGMNQFKEYFLGTKKAPVKRIADTQKCLRVSGKHNDLEEVGVDTYHHTMFEMLGNWSFGDYFKNESIRWGWELLTEVYQLPKDRLYVTVFEGDPAEKLEFDQEAYDVWKSCIAEDRILRGNKKDNFWEMGESGPCGPCSEIHIDLRTEEERNSADGKQLVNAGHPQVVEIWNHVFIQFNRKSDGSLESLPEKHVDTGMGFERLCMALQGKRSNYDTDVFQPLIQFVAEKAGVEYGQDERSDIALRVIADHIRAISFTIADGQLPSNTGAGYVIRRILRRAVRYGYSVLGLEKPFLHSLLKPLVEQMGEQFPELRSQQDFIAKVIFEEEKSFFKTLREGIQKFNSMEEELRKQSIREIPGKLMFELFDTYGFPADLTRLMAMEKAMSVDESGFEREMQEQKQRSKAATQLETEDWVILDPNTECTFTGYDSLEEYTSIIRYRKISSKNKVQFQLVLENTPFYAESGGQVGDTGYLESNGTKYLVRDTKKENNLIVHLLDKLPEDVGAMFKAVVNREKRMATAAHHSATHLMHSSLRNTLGTHVAQKGSLVNDQYLRFDFSHFSKLSDAEIEEVERIVNDKITENIALDEQRMVPIQEAMAMGATALFGEKYGDQVRVISFDKSFSMELCGGTHVRSTGEIGLFKILSEASVSAGVRRIEAVCGKPALNYFNEQLKSLEAIKESLKSPKDVLKSIEQLQQENSELKQQLEKLLMQQVQRIKEELKSRVRPVHGVNLISELIELNSAEATKNLMFELRKEIGNHVIVIGNVVNGKPMLSLMMDEKLIESKEWNAAQIIKMLAKEIKGGGGGQAFYATAGGTDSEGLATALKKAEEWLSAV